MTKDDLISRQAAIDAVHYYIESGYKCDIFQELKDLPYAEPKRKWIPVTERLPEEEIKSYWVCTDTKYQCECRWTNNIYGIGGSNEWGGSIFDIPQYTKVVAWMPLPVSWKGE